jgi:hypothetical protein
MLVGMNAAETGRGAPLLADGNEMLVLGLVPGVGVSWHAAPGSERATCGQLGRLRDSIVAA